RGGARRPHRVHERRGRGLHLLVRAPGRRGLICCGMGMRRGLAWWDAEPGPRPLRDVTVGEVLVEAAADSPDREAVVAGHVRRTFPELLEGADRLAAGLIGLGVAPGDRVAVWAPHVPAWLAAEFGLAR